MKHTIIRRILLLPELALVLTLVLALAPTIRAEEIAGEVCVVETTDTGGAGAAMVTLLALGLAPAVRKLWDEESNAD